jgi:hypothetical protein
MDIRLRRTVEDLVFPTRKEGSNPRSLAYLRRVMEDKSGSVLFATFPKSGWNWTGDILGYCAIRKHTGHFELKFAGEGSVKNRQRKPMHLFTPADARSVGHQRVSDLLPGIPGLDYCFHTHGHWHYSPLWHLDSARTVFITRNIPTSLFSYYKSRLAEERHANFEEFIADGVLDRAILFHNSWAEFKRLPKARFQAFRYEDMRQTPHEVFAQIYEYVFRQPIEPAILAEALDFFSFERQKQREIDLGIEARRHFHYKGKASYDDEMAPQTLAMIKERLRRDLKDNFGYDYSA